MRNRIFYILIFFGLAISLLGQEDFYFHSRIIQNKELKGKRLGNLVEDDNGFIWIASNEGIIRFDGYQFDYLTKESHGLHSNNVYGLYKDDVGDIWISYPYYDFIRSSIQILRPESGKVLSLQEKLGDIYSEDLESYYIPVHGHQNNILLRAKNKTSYVYFDKKLYPTRRSSFHFNPLDHKFWSSSNNRASIYQINLEDEVIDSFYLGDEVQKISLHISQKGSLLASVSSKLITHIYDKVYYKKYDADEFIELPTTSDSRPWTYGYWKDNITYYEKDAEFIPIQENAKAPPNITLFDSQHNFWSIQKDKISISSPKKRKFRTYLKDKGIEKSWYGSRNLWVQDDYLYTMGLKGTFRYNLINDNVIRYTERPRGLKSLFTLYPKNDSTLWIGSNKLLEVDLESGQIKERIEGNTDLIWSIFEDKNGRVWLGQREFGLYYYEPDKMSTTAKYVQLNGFDAIQKATIIQIIEDKRDNNYLWLSTQSGWYRLHLEDGIQSRYWSQGETGYTIPAIEINYTFQDADGIFWLATAYSGLLRVDLDADGSVKSTQSYTIQDGLSSNTLNAIYEDEHGYLWISSNNGIIRFHKQTKSIRVYLEEEGLPHHEFNRISSFQTEGGDIFFGSVNGVVSFHPDDFLTEAPLDIPLKIAKCEKYSDQDKRIINFTNEVLEKEQIILNPKDRFVKMNVSFQNYIDILDVQYAYRIKGLEKEFTLSDKNEITLSGLPYGSYTLEVKAKNRDGRYSDQVISLPLIIQRPFYATYWFLVGVILLTIAGFWFLLKYRTRTLEAREKELEHLVNSRTQQIQEQAKQLEKDKNTIEAQAKELLSLDKVKSRFFANISHELRTPLTLILSPVQGILKRQNLNTKDFTSLTLIKQNAQKLLTRINEILDLTKLEAKEVELKPQPTPFYDFFKRLIATFDSLAAQKDQIITFDYQLDKDLILLLDQNKYEYVVNNFLSNAIKYTQNGGSIHVLVAEKVLDKEQESSVNSICFSVADNGQGIVQEDLDKIFNRYYQSKNHQNKAGSSGIGLALTQEIATLMEGKVWAESEFGEGSTFYFAMPFIETSRLTELPPKEAIEPLLDASVYLDKGEHQGEKSNILLVEDNPQLRKYIQMVLQDEFNILTAQNGQEALEHIGLESSNVWLEIKQ